MLPIAIVGALIGVASLVASGIHLFHTFRDFRQAANDLHHVVEQTEADPELLGLSHVELWQSVLRRLNVETRLDEDNKDRYLFDYQGGHFYVDIDNSAFAELYFAFIDEVDLSDVDEVSLIRRAINEANYGGTPTIVYSTNEEEDKMYVHMVQSVLLMPQIPHIKEYMQSRLAVFFQLHRRLASIEDRMRQEV